MCVCVDEGIGLRYLRFLCHIMLHTCFGLRGPLQETNNVFVFFTNLINCISLTQVKSL